MPTRDVMKAGEVCSGRAGNHVKDKAASLRTRTRKVRLE